MMMAQAAATPTTTIPSLNLDLLDQNADNNLDDTSADAYFAELLSHPLDRLSKEPQLLEAEARRAKARGLEAALTRGKTAFPSAAAALSSAASALREATAAAAVAAAALPDAGDAADAFARAAPALARRMAADAAARRGASAAAELAEAPALAAAAARGGGFDEALALRALLSRAALLHPSSSSLSGQANNSSSSSCSGAALLDAAGGGAAAAAARAALLERLSSGPLPLAECLRCVGYLRRLAGGGKKEGKDGEASLRAAFLRARGRWLSASVAAAAIAEISPSSGASSSISCSSSANAPLEAIKRLTDVHRTQLFDVATQFRAVFGGGSGIGSAGSGGSSSAAEADLSAWLSLRLASYLDSLTPALSLLKDGASLRAALDHASFAAASLGRGRGGGNSSSSSSSSSSGAGADLRSALPPPFERAALELLARNLGQAVAGFEAGLAAHSWVVLPVPATAGATGAATTAGGANQPPPPPPPPYSLLAHAPVARLSNALSASLNDLRACAPPGAGSRAAALFGDALAAAAGAARSAAAARSGGGGRSLSLTSTTTATTAAAAEALSEATTRVALPHAAACFACVYPEHSQRVERALRRAVAEGEGNEGGGGGGEGRRGGGGALPAAVAV